jgi:transcriptional regulator with XRE-family HTH domain
MMVLDFLRSFLPPDNIPNRFTIAVGELIKNARIDAGLTQEELSWNAYIPQSTLSKMENGKAEPSASEIVYLSNALSKPITYFYPNQIVRHLKIEEVEDELLNKLLMLGRKLDDGELRKIIAQVRAIIELNSSGTL